MTERRIRVITGEVGAGKTVVARAALCALDPTRHSIIYLPNPTVGVRRWTVPDLVDTRL